MFTKDIGIDLGTANTLVYMRGKGIIIREPSVVAVNTRTDKCRYVGKEAKDVIGRTPGSIVAVRPLKDGVIADFDIATTMLQEFIKKALELHADVLLVSQTVTQKDVHIQNLTNLIELLEAEGLRDKFVVCCGGPRITHELAKELGYDAGFGAGKYADDVASFAVTEMVKRGMK